MNKAICLIVALACMLACHDANHVWQEQQSIDGCNWSSSDALHYHIQVDDTVSLFNLFIDVRNRTDYPFSNLYLFVTAQAPTGATSTDTVDYTLAKDNGEWTGKGMMSKFKDNRFPYRTNIRFPVKGEYLITVKQGMRRDSLPGIANIGIRLEYTNQ